MALYRIRLITPEGERGVACDDRTFVLAAALEQDIPLPYSCQQGWCVTCAARLIEGEIDQSAALRYYPQDRAAGFILTCIARPLSDLTIQTHQKVAMQAHRSALGLPVPLG